MAYCAWTSLCEYINAEVGNSGQQGYTPLELSAAAELFDRVCNVFGWSILSRVTGKKEGNNTQTLTYKLSPATTRSRRFLRCCMIDKVKFPHDCGLYNKSFTTEGDFEAAIKIDKKTLIDWTRELKRYYYPRSQGPPVTTTGDGEEQQSDGQNTALLTDLVVEKEAQFVTQEDWIAERVSTEKMYEFPEILDRWIPLKQIKVQKDVTGKLAHYLLPLDLEKDSCVSNVFPFEQFAYGSYEFEMQVHCTSNPRQAGRAIVGVTPDPVALSEQYYKDWSQFVQRQHAWIDFASGSTASVVIPFEYHRGLVRNLDHGQNTAGLLGGVSCRVDIWIASPLRIGPDQDAELSLLPFVKVSKAKFGGMGFKVNIKAQGPITDKIRSYKKIIDQADSLLEVLGETTGLDKPLDPTLNMIVTPVPRMNFAVGKGVTDASVLKLSHFQTTSMPSRVKQLIKHNTVGDIIKQIGFLSSFQWNTTLTQGDLLKIIVMSPCDFVNPLSSPNSFPEWYPTPLSNMANMFQFWTGTVVLSFVFPATDQHKGKLLCTIEFSRTSNDDKQEKCQAYAAYHVVFDLGNNRRFDVVVPNIYDTPWRRCNVVPLASHFEMSSVKEGVKYRTGLLQKINTRITLKVVNPLRANKTVTNVIDCLIFACAGADFELLGLTQYNLLLPAGVQPNSFPDEYSTTQAIRTRRGVEDRISIKKASHAHKTLGEVLGPDPVETLERSGQVPDQDLNLLKQQLLATKTELEVLKAQQNPSTQECVEIQQLEMLNYALAQWNANNTHNRVGANLSKTWQEHTLTLENVPSPEYTVGTKSLQQRASFGGPYYVGSQAWESLARTGALLAAFLWADVPRGQGKGDYTTDVVKFSPKTNPPPHTTLVTTPENSLWTLLRTPVQIQRSKTVGAMGDKLQAYFIPLMPPQWSYIQKDEDKTKPTIFDSMVVTSPHVALTSQFRFWRGSMRYTIIAPRDAGPVYITYIPHSGVRLVGNKVLTNDKDTAFSELTIGMSGNRTEILIPSVNPTAHVEVPFMTENVWATMNNGNVNGNFYWRDKGDDNVGHLVISSDTEVKIDVWWAAGDDFRVSGYLGALYCSRPRAADALTDDHPRAQADFRPEEGASLELVPSAQIDVWSTITATTSVCTAALSLPNVIGLRSMITEARPLVGKTSDVLDAVSENLAQSHDVLKALTLSADAVPEALHHIAEKVVSVFNKVTRTTLATTQVVKGLLDLYVCWRVKDVTVIVSTLIRWFLDIGLITTDYVARAVKDLSGLFIKDDVPRSQADRDSALKQFITLIVEALGFAMKFSKARVKAVVAFVTSYTKLRDFCFTIRSLQFLFQFLEGLVNLISDLWYYFVGYSDPESKLAHILHTKGEVLTNFVADVHFFLRPEQKKLLQISPKARLRYYAALQVAYMVKKLLIKLDTRKDGSLIELSKLIDQLMKFNTEIFEEIATSPVRFEPFVVCLEGDSAIGKSYLTAEFVTELLELVNWPKDVDPIYIRTPGKDFWDGWAGQPVVIFDDLHNVADPQVNVQVISDIYALKSSAVFVPNMARLEEKNTRGNPLIVIQLTNTPFFTSAEMNSLEAYYRRRDLMARVRKTGSAYSEDFNHLAFETYQKWVPTPEYPEGQLTGIEMPYQNFLKYVKGRWVEYYNQEVKNVQFRRRQYVKCLERESEEHLLDYDPYALMTKHLFEVTTKTHGTEALSQDMDMVFKNYLVSVEKKDVLDMFVTNYQQEIEAGQVHSQVDMEELKDLFGKESQNIFFIARAKMERERQNGNGSTPGDGWSIPQMQVYEKLLIWLTKLCNFETLRHLGDLCGFSHGECSACGSRGCVIVKVCRDCVSPDCRQMWCASCMNVGVVHYGNLIKETSKLQRFYYVIKQMLATLAVTFNVTVGFVCIALLSVLSASFNVLKGLGYWNILYGFFCAMTGNFTFGAKLIWQGITIHALLAICSFKIDSSFLEDYFLHWAGTFALARSYWNIWFGSEVVLAQGQSQPFTLEHFHGYKESCPVKSIRMKSYPFCVGRTVLTGGMALATYECAHVAGIAYNVQNGVSDDDIKWIGILDRDNQRWLLPTTGESTSRDIKSKYPLKPVPLEMCPGVCVLERREVHSAIASSLGRVCEHHHMLDINAKPEASIEWKGDGNWLVVGDDGHTELIIENRPCKDIFCPLRNATFVDELMVVTIDTISFMCTQDPHVSEDVVWKHRPYQMFTSAQNLEYHRPYLSKLYSFLNYLNKIREACVWQFCSVKNNFSKLVKVLLGLGLIIGSVIALFRKVSQYWQSEKRDTSPAPFEWEQVVHNQATLDYKRNAARRSKNPNRQAPKSRLSARAQGTYENSMSIAALVMRNMIQLTVVNTTGKSIKMNGLGVHDHLVIFPKHFYTIIARHFGQQACVNFVLQGDRSFPALMSEEDFVVDEQNDLMFWTAPPSLQLFANIVRHFAPESFYTTTAIPGQGFMMIPPIRQMPIPTIQGLFLQELLTQQTVQGLDGEYYEILDTVTYNFSMDGACGSPVFRNSSITPIIGFHVAGSGEGISGTGYALIITQEMLEAHGKVRAQFDVYDLNCIDEAVSNFDESVNVYEIGAVEPKLSVVQPKKTKIIKSIIADDLQISPKRVPAPLGPNEGIYSQIEDTPLLSGCAHHSHEVLDIGQRVENEIGSLLESKYEGMRPTIMQPKKLTIEQTIVGFKNVQYYDPMDLRTSPGWPYNREREGDKHAWISVDRDKDDYPINPTIDPVVIKRVEEKNNLRAEGVVPITIFADVLKDERRDKNKLKEVGSTRIVCMSPLDFTITIRMYFLHFMTMFMTMRLKLNHAVGISPDGPEWAELVKKLQVKNNRHCWTLDYTNFGPGFSPRAARAAFKVMLEWTRRNVEMDERDVKIMETMVYELIQSTHICNDLVYQQTCGSPSGAALTVVLNSLVNEFYLYWAMRSLMRKAFPGRDALWIQKEIDDHVAFVTYGDDVIAATSEKYIDIINARTISMFLKDFNIVSTDSEKGVGVTPYGVYEEQFTFLKRGLVKHPTLPGQYLAPIKWHVVEEAAYYSHSTGNQVENTIENVRASLLLAYGHGEEMFNKWRSKVNSSLVKRGIPPQTMTWQDLDNIFFTIPTAQAVRRFEVNYRYKHAWVQDNFEDNTTEDLLRAIVSENQPPVMDHPIFQSLSSPRRVHKGVQVYRKGKNNKCE